MARPSPPSTTSGVASTTTETARERSDDHQRSDTPMTEPTRYAFKHADQAGYPHGNGTLSEDQIVLIDRRPGRAALDLVHAYRNHRVAIERRSRAGRDPREREEDHHQLPGRGRGHCRQPGIPRSHRHGPSRAPAPTPMTNPRGARRRAAPRSSTTRRSRLALRPFVKWSNESGVVGCERTCGNVAGLGDVVAAFHSGRMA